MRRGLAAADKAAEGSTLLRQAESDEVAAAAAAPPEAAAAAGPASTLAPPVNAEKGLGGAEGAKGKGGSRCRCA